jgi:hypothetical protein
MRVHTADPTAPAGGNSVAGNTVSIMQAKGARRMLPDGKWVTQGSASKADWDATHIPIHRQ